MAWVAFDRAARSVSEFGLDGPAAHWREIAEAIHNQVCDRGFDHVQGSFVQSYGASSLDASLLLIPLVGFLPSTDLRVRGTVAAIERTLLRAGLVQRYHTREEIDGLPAGEGIFLACSCWLADNYLLQGSFKKARAVFKHLLSLRNDLGLLAEEYDPVEQRQLGNYPQAFSHLALINTAHNLIGEHGPAYQRSARSE
jgi:GH15 family glucan-1,4-alpha-glucosidase